MTERSGSMQDSHSSNQGYYYYCALLYEYLISQQHSSRRKESILVSSMKLVDLEGGRTSDHCSRGGKLCG